MKVQPSVKKICDKCKVIRRNGRVMVICETCATSARAEQLHLHELVDRPWTTDIASPAAPGPEVLPGRHPGTEAEDRAPGDSHGITRPRNGVVPDLRIEHRRTTQDGTSCRSRPPAREARRDRSHHIFGVGRTRAKEATAAAGIADSTRVRDLTDEQVVALRDYLEGNHKLEGDLVL